VLATFAASEAPSGGGAIPQFLADIRGLLPGLGRFPASEGGGELSGRLSVARPSDSMAQTRLIAGP
jgi:hypothetical protein